MNSTMALAQPIPGPRPIPGLGWRANMLPLLRKPVPYMLQLYREYGDIVSLGGDGSVFVFAPEYNRQVLSDQHLYHNGDLESSSVTFRIPLDSAVARLFSGLTTRNGADHIRQRRLLMPTFHRKHIDSLRDDMLALIEQHAAGWQAGQRIDLLAEMKRLTLAVAVKTILGLNPATEGEEMRLMMERWLRLTLSPGVFLLPADVPGLPFYRLLSVAERVEGEIRAMIARKRAAGSGHDALSMLLQAHDEDGAALTDDELLGHTTTLFIAGHETTASALTWTLFLLDRHPAVLRDLVDELQGTLHGAAPRTDQLNSLPLLDAVINESLRLLPPGLFFLRVTKAPVYFGDYHVAANTRIFWSPAVTHRIPELFPEPQRFLPRRWEAIDPSPYEYLPFGAGPRRCLGATFAMMELKLTLAVLLQRFRLALPDGARVDMSASPLAAPSGGMPIRIMPAEAQPARTRISGTVSELVDLN